MFLCLQGSPSQQRYKKIHYNNNNNNNFKNKKTHCTYVMFAGLSESTELQNKHTIIITRIKIIIINIKNI